MPLSPSESDILSTARATVIRMGQLAAASRCPARWSQAYPWERPERATIDDITEKALKMRRATAEAAAELAPTMRGRR